MNKNFNEKKSDYLLELALEEQLEYDEEMSRYSTDQGQTIYINFPTCITRK